MRVFFTTPYAGKAQYQLFIDEILAVLRKNEVTVISPEDSPHYRQALKRLEEEGLKTERAHYAYISQGIADADVVIIEASYEDFRVGHEATLALLYNKPTLILSQKVDYGRYIPHELLFGRQYKSVEELRQSLQEFLDKADDYLQKASETSQAIGNAADSLHIAALAAARHGALQDVSEFGNWARLAEEDSEKAYEEIQKTLGQLPIGDAWSVFAPIYNEDTPDYIFTGVANFVHNTLKKYAVTLTDPIADVAAGTAALARNLVGLGHRDIVAFDQSREMLAEAFRLCSHLPSIKIIEARVQDVRLVPPLKAMAWVDFSSNYAMTAGALQDWLTNLLRNILSGGLLIFDVRTVTGWQVNFFHQKVTTFATANFQRIWINLPDYKNQTITFDIFVRTRQGGGSWGEWRREQMTERMWPIEDVRAIVAKLSGCTLEGVFDDNFSPVTKEEPGLAYFVLRKV